jgi:hypothetical protein
MVEGKTKIVTVTERGWAGHSICSDRCQFKRNTLLECNENETRIVISTVGVLILEQRGEIETIGADRYYETKAFHAKFLSGIYWDADIYRMIAFISPWAIHDKELDADLRANNMHDTVVGEILEGLRKGITY